MTAIEGIALLAALLIGASVLAHFVDKLPDWLRYPKNSRDNHIIGHGGSSSDGGFCGGDGDGGGD